MKIVCSVHVEISTFLAAWIRLSEAKTSGCSSSPSAAKLDETTASPQSTNNHGKGLKTSTDRRLSHDQKLRNEIELFTLSEKKKQTKNICVMMTSTKTKTKHILRLIQRLIGWWLTPFSVDQSDCKTNAKPKQSCVYFRQSFKNGSILAHRQSAVYTDERNGRSCPTPVSAITTACCGRAFQFYYNSARDETKFVDVSVTLWSNDCNPTLKNSCLCLTL